MVRRLKIRSKLALVVALPLVGLMLLSLIGWQSINKTKIGSDTYGDILVAEELVADSKAPSQYIIGAFLEIHELVLSDDADAQAKHLAELDELKTDFYAKHEVWVKELASSDRAAIAVALTDKAFKPADAFFKTVDNELIPLVEKGDLRAARELVAGDLEELYDQHEEAITEVRTLASAYQDDEERAAAATVTASQLIMLIGMLSLILAVGALGYLLYRSIGSSIAKLTRRARYAATEELPLAVARVQEGDESAVLLAPIEAEGEDELAELAQAMSTMQQTAVDIAAEQARLRRNVSEMFVNLGRRNQSLLNRTLAFITELERNERDPEVLDDLFRLDHLATRMRRNAESLLVLAGAEAARTWSQPVDLADVVRSALSEVESYDRVDLTVLDKVSVKGTAVADVAHLLAELIENAAVYSPPHSRVNVVGKVSNDGYLISVIDQGIGMASEDLAEANRRIDEVARFDTSPSRVLGLFVVGRLAARHGIVVRLVESATEGVTAKVKLPLSLLAVDERTTLNPALDDHSYADMPALPADIPALAAPSLESWLDDDLEPMAPPVPASWDDQSDHDVAATWAAGSADASTSLWNNAPVVEEPLWGEPAASSASIRGDAAAGREAQVWGEPAAAEGVSVWDETPVAEATSVWGEPSRDDGIVPATGEPIGATADTIWNDESAGWKNSAAGWDDTTAAWDNSTTAEVPAAHAEHPEAWVEVTSSSAFAADLGWDDATEGDDGWLAEPAVSAEIPWAAEQVHWTEPAGSDAWQASPTEPFGAADPHTETDWSAPAAPPTVLGGTDWALGAPVAEWAADDAAEATETAHPEAEPLADLGDTVDRPSFAARSLDRPAFDTARETEANAPTDADPSPLDPLPLSPNAAALWATGAGTPLASRGSDAVDAVADLGEQPAVAPVPPPPPPLPESAVMEIWPNGEAPSDFQPAESLPERAAQPEFAELESNDLESADLESYELAQVEPAPFELAQVDPAPFESAGFTIEPTVEEVVFEDASAPEAEVWTSPAQGVRSVEAFDESGPRDIATQARSDGESDAWGTAEDWADFGTSQQWPTDGGALPVAPPPAWDPMQVAPAAEFALPAHSNSLPAFADDDAQFRQADFGPGGFAVDGSPVPPPPPLDWDAPVAEAPAWDVPVPEAPAWDAPVAEAPAWDAPAAEAPAWDVPAAEAPAWDVPVPEAPAWDAPVPEAPAWDAPVPEAPAWDAPVAEAPAWDAPVAEAPVWDAPVAEAPAEAVDAPPPWAPPPWEPPVADLPTRGLPTRERTSAADTSVRPAGSDNESSLSSRVVETFGWAEREPEAPVLTQVEDEGEDARTASGLTRRVRGAHLPDTGPNRNRRDGGLPGRSPEEIRRALSSFQMGKLRGTRDAHGSDDMNDDQGGASA